MADVPSGAVTFLFTDIEGSTRLVKQLRERYAAVLADHRQLLRDAFDAHDGYEVDTQGDSFFVAFSSAREAVLAAVEGQLALLSHSWPEGVEIKVRMGLHTGQAVAHDGRYTGLAVHRAARIGAAGHGGQILVSQATQTLLEDEEEDLHVSLRDLGEQRLKDLDRPVRLFQAAAEGLPDSFPPVRGDAQLALAAEAAIAPPPWRRPRVVLAGLVGLIGLAVLTAALLARGGSAGGLAGIQANHVGVIDPGTNEIVAEVPVGIRPGPIAAGAGSIWVGNLDDRTLTRIDVAQRAATAAVSLDDKTPTGIAVGTGGVWVAHGFLGQVARVDPQFNRVVTTIDVASRTPPGGSVAVEDGVVWAAFGDSTLARIDPAQAGPPELGVAGALPSALVVANGAVWVVNSADSTVQRFNPATFREGAVRTISVGSRPTAIGYGEGALWVANTSDDSITRIDPANSATRTIGVGVGPGAVAVGAGAVWVANASDRTVSRVDPTTSQVVETIDVGNVPVRCRVQRRIRLGNGPDTLNGLLQTGGGEVECGPEDDATHPLRHERRFGKDADRCRGRTVTRESHVELAIRGVTGGTTHACGLSHQWGEGGRLEAADVPAQLGAPVEEKVDVLEGVREVRRPQQERHVPWFALGNEPVLEHRAGKWPELDLQSER